MKIELGVLDQPYAGTELWTGDVAQFLENKYGIIATFVEVYKKEIKAILERSFTNSFEEIVLGLPPRNVYSSGLQEIQMLMKRWLSTQEVERQGIKGVPTKAALDGVSSRFKSGLNGVTMKQFNKGVRQGKRRPSFIDTGLYEVSLKAWMELQE